MTAIGWIRPSNRTLPSRRISALRTFHASGTIQPLCSERESYECSRSGKICPSNSNSRAFSVCATPIRFRKISSNAGRCFSNHLNGRLLRLNKRIPRLVCRKLASEADVAPTGSAILEPQPLEQLVDVAVLVGFDETGRYRPITLRHQQVAQAQQDKLLKRAIEDPTAHDPIDDFRNVVRLTPDDQRRDQTMLRELVVERCNEAGRSVTTGHLGQL